MPRLLPHALHRRLHNFAHERFGWPYGPWGYFGCRACDEEWIAEHPEDREILSGLSGRTSTLS
jgi:hypothetical protein